VINRRCPGVIESGADGQTSLRDGTRWSEDRGMNAPATIISSLRDGELAPLSIASPLPSKRRFCLAGGGVGG